VPECGWTDLDTPQRVAAASHGAAQQDAPPHRVGSAALDLASALRRREEERLAPLPAREIAPLLQPAGRS
jgi:hypothetical protein